MERKAGKLVWLLFLATGCAMRWTTPRQPATEVAAAPAASARIFQSGSGRMVPVPEAVAFLGEVLRVRSSMGSLHAERVEERADQDGNRVRSHIREFEDGSVAVEQETFDGKGRLIRFKAYDEDGSSGARAGIRIEQPESGFRLATTAHDLARCESCTPH